MQESVLDPGPEGLSAQILSRQVHGRMSTRHGGSGNYSGGCGGLLTEALGAMPGSCSCGWVGIRTCGRLACTATVQLAGCRCRRAQLVR
jgi:hypothetical protein